jgi:SAC3 family protein LENG8/THP3
MYSAATAMPPWQNGHYGQPAQNAYIPVTARQNFAAVPPPPTYIPQPFGSQTTSVAPVAVDSQPKKKTEWSPEVRDYVSRSFAQENASQSVSRAEVEAKLKQIITEHASTNRLNDVNWATYPLPQQIIAEERSRAALAPLLVPFHPQTSTSGSSAARSLQSEPKSKKRKSNEFAESANNTAQPPWRNNSKPAGGLADRVSFAPADKRQKTHEVPNTSKSNLEARRRRFEDARPGNSSPSTPRTPHGRSPEPERIGPVVGRSTKLEKNYFRLTSAPNPDDVRPLPILRQTLELLKKKWRSEGNYVYICDQFKSLRQDLTVQHIKNEFTTNVYEIHARIALEKGDLGEYNQCQTQLRGLYKQKLGGRPVEFKAYRILYYIHTCNRTDMTDVLAELTPTEKAEEAIQHALQVRSAVALGNYHKFFQLYLRVPNMGAYLMDMFVERERLAALAKICRT